MSLDVLLDLAWSWPASIGVLVGTGVGWWLRATVGAPAEDVAEVAG